MRPRRSRRASRRSISRPSARSSCGARRRLGQLQALLQALGDRARAQRRVTPPRERPRLHARLPEAVRQRRPRHRRQLAERAHAEALEHRRQRRRLLAHAEQRHGQRRQVGAQRGGAGGRELRPARAGGAGGGQRREARGRRPDPHRGGQRAPRRGDDALQVSPVQRAQALRVEPREPGAPGLDGRADALQPGEQALPLVGHPGRVRRHEPQRRTAGQRLPEPQPGAHAVGLGGRGRLADQLLAPRLGRQRDRPGGQRLAAAGGDRRARSGGSGRRRSRRTHVRTSDGCRATSGAPDSGRGSARCRDPLH